MNSLIREKAKVARLRTLYENEADPLIKRSIRFRLAEARLWHDVAEKGVLSPEKIEPLKDNIEKILSKARHRVKKTVAVISIAVILAIVLFGCTLAKEGLYGIGRCAGAAGEDAKWITEQLAGNIQVEQEK